MNLIWENERALERPFGYRGTHLAVEGIPLRSLAVRFGTPTFVTAEARIRANIRRLRTSFLAWGPNFRVHYAIKANPQPAILRIVQSEGCGADASSPAEIRLAREAGIAPAHIVYTAAYPSAEELATALRAGVVVNLDDPGLLHPMLALGRPTVLSFRLNPGIRRGGAEGLALGGTESKFGAPADRLIPAYRTARGAGVERFGVHTMLGSNLLSASEFSRHAVVVGAFLKRLRTQVGIVPEFVDVGGGLGVPYRPAESPLDVEALAGSLVPQIVGALAQGERTAVMARPTLLLEPGRYLVADSTVLLTRVTFVKRRPRRFVGVDAGMQTLLRPALYGAYHAVYPVGAGRRSKRFRTQIVGPICEPADVLARDRMLPELEAGDCLAVGNAGAYGFAMSNRYNARPLPAEILVARGRAYLIRRRERFQEMVANTVLPPHLCVRSPGRMVPSQGSSWGREEA